MFTHMVAVKKDIYSARGTDYELLVYRVVETGEYRIYVTNGEIGVGDMFAASQEVVQASQGVDVVEELMKIAKGDIERNEFHQY